MSRSPRLTKDKDHPSPLAGLFDLLDRDGDGKLYPKELEDFVDRQAEAARDRMVLTASDQGRAIFSILDLNRDRRLGNREVRGTLDRVATWDRDGDGRITADEIPHHYQLTLGRGQLAGVGNAGIAASVVIGCPRPRTPSPPGRTGSGGWTATATATSPAASSAAPRPSSTASTATRTASSTPSRPPTRLRPPRKPTSAALEGRSQLDFTGSRRANRSFW